MAHDHVYINGLRVMVLIGVLPHERLTPQPIQIDVDVEVDLRAAGVSDDLATTVNYGAMCDAIAEVARNSQDLLLERLAHRVAQCVLSFEGVSTAHVTITKLQPPIDEELASTAVKISRTREMLAEKSNITDVQTHTVAIALGSNLGDRISHLKFAVAELDNGLLGHVVAQSQVFETDPVGGPDNQGAYMNMVLTLSTSLDPYALLRQLNDIEARAHRERLERWGPRTLDLDIVFYDNISLNDPHLTLPHPRWVERRFVLAPLAEIAPERCPANWESTAPECGVYPRGMLSSL